ncbi:hypothetical protein QQS21_000554 [Conoideocrella luteorostrata]|uniref:Uncharacterized protein n=1 Tax=Conoideocrella luteorostrata TaxID=1105319 RepID=A0AAJ0D0V3_9HYPO|nr:hypothetical protein QQS21_000554 [Conoideocrella luteorostrata]
MSQMPFSNILGRHTDKWENPKDSMGESVGPLHGGRYHCWEAVGSARQAFTQLSPEIKGYLEASNIPAIDSVSWSMYMIGRTPEKAAPKLLICSTDRKARKFIRKLIKGSKIMEKHPGVGLGDISALPGRHVVKELSRETIQGPRRLCRQ